MFEENVGEVGGAVACNEVPSSGHLTNHGVW
jgi:hypothetical protein